MSTTKYEKQYEEMIKINKSLFDELKKLSSNPKTEEFASLQRQIIRVIRKNEDRLCSRSENANFSSFTTNLANKFWEKIRENYPEVDYLTD